MSPDLKQNVHAALTRDPRVNLSHSNIDISAEGRVVTLEGNVPTVAAKRLATSLARSLPEVTEVRDQLKVKIVNPMGDLEIATHIRRSFVEERNIEEDHVAIDVDTEGGVTLRGQVHSLIQRRLCEVLCWWIPGVSAVSNLIIVDPPDQDTDEELRDNLMVIMEKDNLVDPKEFKIVVRDRKVFLSGEVDSETVRDAAENDCWFTPGVADVSNDLTLR